jgi:hypothetical protein
VKKWRSKMSWNYRIVHSFGVDTKKKIKWNSYGVYEVYYDKNGDPDYMTQNMVSPRGTTLSEFFKSWILYKKAFTKDILHYDNDKNKFVNKDIK